MLGRAPQACQTDFNAQPDQRRVCSRPAGCSLVRHFKELQGIHAHKESQHEPPTSITQALQRTQAMHYMHRPASNMLSCCRRAASTCTMRVTDKSTHIRQDAAELAALQATEHICLVLGHDSTVPHHYSTEAMAYLSSWHCMQALQFATSPCSCV